MNSESAILGSLLADYPSEVPPNLARLLRHAPDSFHDMRLGKIAVAIRETAAAGKPVGNLTVGQYLNGDADDALLAEVSNEDLPIALAEYEAGAVWEKYRTRRLRTVFDDAGKALESAPDRADSIASGAAAAIADLSRPAVEAGLTIRTPSELLAMTFDESDRLIGDRLLSRGGSLVIAGPGSIGKSRLLLQLAVACRAGLPFIGFETRATDLRFLILQAENSNRRLQSDFTALRAWVGDRHWPTVESGIFVHTLESDADGFLSLDSDAAQARIREVITRHKPDVVGWDSLYNFGSGDLNSDEAMAATLLTLSRLTKAGNPQRASVLLHHALTGKAGAARAVGYDRSSYGRNSKLLHQWTRAQINLAPGSPDSNDAIVCSCGKLNDGQPFPPFAIRLDQDAMIYTVDPDFDLAAWESDVSGKKEREPLMTVERVRELCTGSQIKSQLAKRIVDDCGCARSTAFEWINRAQRKGKLHYTKATETYVAKP